MLHLSHGDAARRGRTSTSRSTRRSASAILTASPGPGAKLSLHELAAELGVSRSPVHHALTRLVSEGLLTVKARRGYFVTPGDARRRSREGYDVRLALELHAADARSARVGRARLAALPALHRGDGDGDLARGVGRGERRLPRVPGRPRRQRAALARSTGSSR